MDLSDLDGLKGEYEAAQDAADSQREAYHAAIRKLYMSGISLREIADHLGISHQRVHKIVGLEPPKRKRSRTQISASIFVVLLSASIGVLLLAVGVLAGPNLLYRDIFLQVREPTSAQISRISERLESDSRVAAWAVDPEVDQKYSPPSRPGTVYFHDSTRKFWVQPKSLVDGYWIAREYGSLTGVHLQGEGERQLSLGRSASWIGAILAFAAGFLFARKLRRNA